MISHVATTSEANKPATALLTTVTEHTALGDESNPQPPPNWPYADVAQCVRQRAREAEREEPHAGEADEVLVIQAPVRVARIVAALEREAANGNANAARELRAWLSEYPPEDTELSFEKMDRALRQKILARLIAEVEEDERNPAD